VFVFVFFFVLGNLRLFSHYVHVPRLPRNAYNRDRKNSPMNYLSKGSIMLRIQTWLVVVLLCTVQYVLGDLAADATPSESAPGATPKKLVRPFNGENLEGWRLKRATGSHWVVGTATVSADDPTKLVVSAEAGELVNSTGQGVDIFTAEKYGDCLLEIELMVPKGSNSGIYLHGNYEVQVFDSWGKDQAGPGDIGGIYGAAAPKENAAKAPGEWQQFVIDFRAPRFDGDKKVENALFKQVVLNGKVIHENVEVAGPTGGNLGQGESATGPLMFQGDHGAVAYRNIRISLPD
jgi:hypothetical protein